MINLPNLPTGGDFVIGNMLWSLVVTGLITVITRYKPLTEKTIQLLKGVFSVLGYFIVVATLNLPDAYTGFIMLLVTALGIFLSSSGAYDIGKSIAPELVKSNIDYGERNRGA